MELLFVEREIVIRNRGSVEFSEEELASDILLIDVKCTALAGTDYVNNKTLPPYGYYGCVTLFGGATVAKRIPLEFAYQRVLDFESTYRRLRCYLTKIEEICGEIFNYVTAPNNVPPAGSAEPRDAFDYRGLPYAKLKISNVRATQWTVTVRSYKEADAECESQSKSDDPTKGEPEYPSPIPIPDPDNFPASLPEPDEPYPGADPNDFDPDQLPDWTPRTVYFGLRIKAWDGNQNAVCTPNLTYFENVSWENAGPPPYTTRNAGLPSPCSNAGNGYIITADDGTESQVFNPGGTTYEALINVFQFEPFADV